MTRNDAVQFLKNKPYKFGHLLGFTKLTKLHNRWIKEMLCGRDDMSLAASRNTYKTTCDSIALALIIILLPKVRTMFMRKTDDDVKEIIKQTAKILKDPHTQYFVQTIYGVSLNLTVESVFEISTNLVTDAKGTSQLVGIGMGSSLTGKHFDRIFTDDIINIKDRISKAERERTKLIYQELQNLKNRDGRIINTLTIWHKDDASTLMPNLVKYDCYHPEVTSIITEEVIQEKKESMTPSLFACNYELKIIADENVLFPEPQQNGDASYVFNGICHLDSAFYGEDYTAFTIMVYEAGKYYTFGKIWRKHVEDCYGEILNLYLQFMCGKMYIEKNADKGMVSRDLRNIGIRTINYDESMNKHIKISTYLKAIWADVVFVDGTDPEYIEQICDYTEDADHDDAPDSMSVLARILYPKIAKREGKRNIADDIFNN